jgi:hypothetical protein
VSVIVAAAIPMPIDRFACSATRRNLDDAAVERPGGRVRRSERSGPIRKLRIVCSMPN